MSRLATPVQTAKRAPAWQSAKPDPEESELAPEGATPAGVPRFLSGFAAEGASAGGALPDADGLIQPKLAVAGSTTPLEEEADELARTASSTTALTGAASTPPREPSTRNRLTGTAGDPLSAGVRQRVEPLLGADLSNVRVHHAPPDRAAAAGIRARAFTHREHIFLGHGENAEDVDLVAHELAHVVQQTAGGRAPTVQRKPADYRHPEDGATPYRRLRQEIEEELGDSEPPDEMPEIDRAEVSSEQSRLEPAAQPAVDRPAEERPGIESAAAETDRKVDEPAQAEGGSEGEKGGEGEGGSGQGVGEAESAAAQAAFDMADVEMPPVIPLPVAPVEQVAPLDAAGKALEPVPGADEAIAEIAEATQSMRDEGTGLQEGAVGDRANARILEGNINLIGRGIAQSDLGVTASQAHAAYRRTVVEQGRAALGASRDKTAWVAEQAPQYLEKADKGREDSEGMAQESAETSAESQANTPDDAEAAERANEQSGEINRAGSDVASLDSAFSGSQERARGLSADAAQAAGLNTQVDTKLTESTDMLQRTEDKLGQMRAQTDAAHAQVGGLAGGPAEMVARADETEAEGRGVVDLSFAVEERLRAEQVTHRANAAAIPPESPEERALREEAGLEELPVETLPPILPMPAQPETIAPERGEAGGGGEADAAAAVEAEPPAAAEAAADLEPIPAAPPGEGAGAGGESIVVQRQPQAGYEDRWDVDLASPIAGEIPAWLGGAAPEEGKKPLSREEVEAREQERRAEEIFDIQRMAGKPFEQTTRWERRGIASRLALRHLGTSLSQIPWPGWGTLALGLINPVTPLLGVVSGFSTIASGVANIFNIEARRRDWVGNLLKVAADVVTGLTVVLGSITALAAVIAALCTALIISTGGILAPVLGPAVAFSASVMVTVGGWTIAVGTWALLLQSLSFIRNLYEAGVARNATELQRSSDRMSSDVSAAGNVALQMGMAKLAQVGGQGMRTSIIRAGGGVRWARGIATPVRAAVRDLGKSLVRPGNFAKLGRALRRGLPEVRGVVGRGVVGAAKGLRRAWPKVPGVIRRGVVGAGKSLWGGVVNMIPQAVAGARALPGFFRSPLGTLRRAFGPGNLSRSFLIGEGVPTLEPTIVALRTSTGVLDPTAYASLLEKIPTVQAANALEIRALAARTVELPPEQIRVEVVGGGIGQQGASGARVYQIFNRPPGGEETMISAVKIFPKTAEQTEEFARELSGLHRLNQETIPNQGAVRTLGVGKTLEGESVLVMTAAPGRTIDDLFIALGRGEISIDVVRRACYRSGEATAKLHMATASATPAVTTEKVIADFRAAFADVEASVASTTDPEVQGLDMAAARARVNPIVAGVKDNPGASAVVHGDLHLGNKFYDPVTDRITYIDAARVHLSIDHAGTGSLGAARDVASFESSIEVFASKPAYGVNRAIRKEMQELFRKGYASAAVEPPFTPEALAFEEARYTTARLKDALTKPAQKGRLEGALREFRRAFELK